MMHKLVMIAALAAVAAVAPAPGIEPSQLLGKWSGRVERPGVDSGGRRMAQVGTAEFSADHRFVCRFPNPEQQEQREQGNWTLKKGHLSITTTEANGQKTKSEPRLVEISHQPLEMRLPVKAGTWFLVLRPVEASK